MTEVLRTQYKYMEFNTTFRCRLQKSQQTAYPFKIFSVLVTVH